LCHRLTQAVERTHRIGREVDVGPHAHELRGLLVNGDRVALCAQGDGRGQTANACAHDGDVQRKRHVPSPENE
jgi:hypothetical protein